MNETIEDRIERLLAEVHRLRAECQQNRRVSDALELTRETARRRLDRITELEEARAKALHLLENRRMGHRERAIRLLRKAGSE